MTLTYLGQDYCTCSLRLENSNTLTSSCHYYNQNLKGMSFELMLEETPFEITNGTDLLKDTDIDFYIQLDTQTIKDSAQFSMEILDEIQKT